MAQKYSAMKDNLLDLVFEKSKLRNLSKKEAQHHLKYLKEIIAQEQAKSRKQSYLRWKRQLVQRYLELNRHS